MAFNQYATGNDSNNYVKLFVNHTKRTKSSWSSTYTYYLAGILTPLLIMPYTGLFIETAVHSTTLSLTASLLTLNTQQHYF